MPARSHASPETENFARTQTSGIVFTFKTGPKNKWCHYLGFGKGQYQGQRASVQGFETESEEAFVILWLSQQLVGGIDGLGEEIRTKISLSLDTEKITTRAKWWIMIKSVALASEGSEFKILMFALQTALNFTFPICIKYLFQKVVAVIKCIVHYFAYQRNWHVT